MTERAQVLIKATDATAGAFASVQGHFKGMHSTLAQLAPQIAAAFSIGGIVLFAKNAIDAGDRMNDLAQKTGLSVESLSKWKFVASQSNTTLEAMQPGLRGLAKNMEDAARGGKESADAFTRLGVPVKDSSGNLRAMDAVMLDLAGKFSTMPDGVQKSALAMRVFGKAGTEMIPILNQGTQGIADLMTTAEKMGLVMSTEAAKAADELKDSLNLLGKSGEALSTQFLITTAPAISAVALALAEATKQAGGFFGGLALLSDISPFSNLGQQLKEANTELERLRKRRDELVQSGRTAGIATFEGGIRALEQRIELMKSLQRQQAMGNAGRDNFDARDFAAQPQKKSSAVLTGDPEALEKRRQSAERLAKELRVLTNEADAAWIKDRDNTMESMRLHQEADRQRSESLASLIAESDAAFQKDRDQTMANNEQRAAQQQTRLESLSTSLMTENELRKFAYEEDFNLLNNTLGMKKGAQEQYYTLMGRLVQRNTMQQLAIERQKNAALRDMQAGTWQLGAELLQQFAGKSKAAAIAVIAINKGLSIAMVIQNTSVAMMRALAELGPIAGPPVAASMKALGALQVGLIAATGLMQAANVGDSGAAIGTPANPISTTPGLGADAGSAVRGSGQTTIVNIDFKGGFISEKDMRQFVKKLNESLRDGGRVVIT